MKKILYVHHYGDQHGHTNNTISDGGSNIHVHLIKKLERRFKIVISTYTHNQVSRHYFSKSKNVTIIEHPTLSGLFKKNLLFFGEIVLRSFYPGLKYLLSGLHFDYVVSQTDFIPDVIAGFFVKIRNSKTIWIASYFLQAPDPWDKNSPYKGRRWIIGLFYWLFQKPSYWLIKSRADFVLVTSQPDVGKFVTPTRDKSKIIIARGGVDIEESERYLNSKKVIPVDKRKYDACFVGRFHYQKGVLGLIDIWEKVCHQRKKAKLAMIGNGPLEADARKKIKKLKLEKNIDLLGYKSGAEKFSIFKQSKSMVHPATYDSGGMAAAEGLAWGLPGVSFDLEALMTYYPKGMLKTACFDKDIFARNIISLLTNKNLYRKTAKDAHDLILESWDWNKQVENISQSIFGHDTQFSP